MRLPVTLAMMVSRPTMLDMTNGRGKEWPCTIALAIAQEVVSVGSVQNIASQSCIRELRAGPSIAGYWYRHVPGLRP